MSKILRREGVRTGEPLTLKKPPLVLRRSNDEAQAVFARVQAEQAEAQKRRWEAAALAVWQERTARTQAAEAYASAKSTACAEGEKAGRRQGKEEGTCMLGQLQKQLADERAAQIEENARTLRAAGDAFAREAEDFAFALAEKILQMPVDRDILRADAAYPQETGDAAARAGNAISERTEDIAPEQIAGSLHAYEVEDQAGAESAEAGQGGLSRTRAQEADALVWETAAAQETPAPQQAPDLQEASAAQEPSFLEEPELAVSQAASDWQVDSVQEEPELEEEPALQALRPDEDDAAEGVEALPLDALRGLPARSLQRLLKVVRLKDMVLAMKGMGSGDSAAVCGAMPRHMRESVEREMEFLGPVRPSDVEQAQKRVSRTVRRLLDAGEL